MCVSLFYSLCRDTCRAVALITLFLSGYMVYASTKVLHSLWTPEDELELLSDAWFPCFIFFFGAMLCLLTIITTVGSCNPQATAPLHLFTGASFVLLPVTLASITLFASEPKILNRIALDDKTGMFSSILEWVDTNQGIAGAAAATWIALQVAVVTAGSCVAMVGPPETRSRYHPVSHAPRYDPEYGNGNIHAPLLGRYYHQRSTSSGGDVYGTAGVYRTPIAGAAGSPVPVLPTTGGI